MLGVLLASGAMSPVWGQQGSGVGGQPAAAAAVTLLPGTWTGPLVVAGKTRTIGLVVTGSAAGPAVAVSMPGAPLHGHALRLVQRGDSLIFSDPAANIRFACEQSGEGRWLIGNWTQLGFSGTLALHRLAPPAQSAAKGAAAVAMDKQ